MAGDTNSSSSSTNDPSSLPAPTSSRCLTHGITATHDYKVTNFSLLVGIGRPVTSSTFTAGGCDWSIMLYPDGDGDGDSDSDSDSGDDNNTAAFTAVFLRLVKPPLPPAGSARRTTRVKFKFTLLDDQGRQVSTKRGKRRKKAKQTNLMRTETSTFYHAGDAWGNHKFFRRSLLQDLLLRDSNDGFTVRCAMAVIRTRTEDDAVIEAPEPSLRRDMARLLADGDGADVTFVLAGDRFFRAHRYVLAARSTVFRAQLFGAMKEAQQDAVVVTVDDMDPGAFAGLLHYIYTDTLADDDDECAAAAEGGRVAAAQHLLVAADRYGLERLRVMCEARLCGWIDVESVATTLALAERHQCAKLREACIRFLSWPDMLRAAMKTDGFGHLVASYPSVASDILDKVVSAIEN